MAIFRKSNWLKPGVYSLLQNISGVLFGFGGFYFLIRILDKSEFGVWALFLTVTSVLETIRIGLLKNGFIKYYNSTESSQHGEILSASLILNVIITAVNIILVVVFAKWVSNLWEAPQLELMFYLYCIRAVLFIPFFQLEFLQHAHIEFKGIFVSNFVRGGLFFLLITAAFYGVYEINLPLLVIMQAGVLFVSSIISYLYSKVFLVDKINLRLNKENLKWVAELFGYGKYVTATNVSAMLYSSIDQFMLGSILNTASVAVYNTSNRISNLANIPTLTIAALVFPHSSKISKDDEQTAVKSIYERSVGFNLAVIIPGIILVLLIPEIIITIIAGEQYLDAVPLLQIIILYSAFVPFARLFGTILDSTGRPQINFYFTLGGLIINVILNYFLILSYGIMGAVLGTMLTNIITFSFMQGLLYKKFRITLKGTFAQVINSYALSWQALMKLLKLRS